MSDDSPSSTGSIDGKSTLVSRNVTVAGHRTSMRLEPEMWNALYDICRRERVSIHALCTEINERKAPNSSLTAAIRVFLMAYYQAAATEEGHARANHGAGRPFQGTPFNRGGDDRVADLPRRSRARTRQLVQHVERLMPPIAVD